jgi:hypothetical protein
MTCRDVLSNLRKIVRSAAITISRNSSRCSGHEIMSEYNGGVTRAAGSTSIPRAQREAITIAASVESPQGTIADSGSFATRLVHARAVPFY